jgi:hypothetical protein
LDENIDVRLISLGMLLGFEQGSFARWRNAGRKGRMVDGHVYGIVEELLVDG